MIKEFQGKYRFLSNFYPVKIRYAGIEYPSVEHAYQAAKTFDHKKRLEIANLKTPGIAKRTGQTVILRHDWEEIKLDMMYDLVKMKFENNILLQKLLLDTNNEDLQEGNWWGDEYWGVNLRTGEGENQLGKILMDIRKTIKNGGLI